MGSAERAAAGRPGASHTISGGREARQRLAPVWGPTYIRATCAALGQESLACGIRNRASGTEMRVASQFLEGVANFQG